MITTRRRSMGLLSAIAFIAAVVSVTSPPVFAAVNLPPGGFLVPPPGEAGPAGPSLTVVQSLTSPFAELISPGGINGTLTSTVYAHDVNNLLGGYTFEYVLANTTGPDAISTLTLNHWGNAQVEVANENGSQVGASIARRLISGDSIDFYFLGANFYLGPGTSSRLLVHTALTQWGYSDGFIQNGGNVQVAALCAAVPEPATLLAGAMLVLPFGVSALRILRPKRT